MIIGIDGNEANVAKRVGVGEVAYWLLYYFAEFRESGQTKHDFVIYLKDKPLPTLPEEQDGWRYQVVGPKKLWTQFALPLNLFTKKHLDIFFTPSHYAPRFSPVPTVVTVLDLAYLKFPELFNKSDLYQLVNWTKYSVKKAKKVITISHSSKNDIIKSYGVQDENVAVVYPGIKQLMQLEPHVYGIKQLQAKYGLSTHYVLFVGTLQPRKNITRLVEAFAKLIEEKDLPQELQLVVVGRRGWQFEEILAAPKKFGIEERVKFLENIPDDELDVLYRHAICYVLPSLYEGFGLPVIEAMQHHCPVITSNISSLPEAGGDAALYVNPEDIDDIAQAMKKLVTNEKLRHELIEKGKKQITKFSWEKAAKETLDILEDVTGK